MPTMANDGMIVGKMSDVADHRGAVEEQQIYKRRAAVAAVAAQRLLQQPTDTRWQPFPTHECCSRETPDRQQELDDDAQETVIECATRETDEDVGMRGGIKATIVRCCRKKFRCALLYALIVLALLECVYLIVKKLDEDTFSRFVNVLFANVWKNASSPLNVTDGWREL